ncbi:MAG: hypothetical protein K1X83_13745 [Oligoflexia bacterium]|nr:hypothetical protein [Oligoflexia bacterium]
MSHSPSDQPSTLEKQAADWPHSYNEYLTHFVRAEGADRDRPLSAEAFETLSAFRAVVSQIETADVSPTGEKRAVLNSIAGDRPVKMMADAWHVQRVIGLGAKPAAAEPTSESVPAKEPLGD